eukprot:TRINITY_DN24107_c0_g1_i4.p1 TRINITY_DN24107_c0_g1~~TRINITY_DN24107_c0_g1_i4.p1  ORF type:complete len:838 (-),score=212.76 TRINITY_DN24107_c0_g1_i4:351-2864(-)
MSEDSIVALFLKNHRARIAAESCTPRISVVGQLGVSLATHLTCFPGMSQQHTDSIIQMCKFLHVNREHDTLAAFLTHQGDEANSPALLYFNGSCSLRSGEDYRASVYDNRVSNDSVRNVQLTKEDAQQVLGLRLQRHPEGLMVADVAPDGLVANSGEIHMGDLILSLNGHGVAGMSSPQFAAMLQSSKLLQFGLSTAADMDAAARQQFGDAARYFLAAAPFGPLAELIQADAMLDCEGWYSVYSYYMNAGKGVIERLSHAKAWDGVIQLCNGALAFLLPYTTCALESSACDDPAMPTVSESPISVMEAQDKLLQMLFGASLDKLKDTSMRCQKTLEQVLSALSRLSVPRSKTAVRQLVKALVPVKSTARDLEALCTLALVGLEDQVEQVLWEEARQHDSSYYDVLHAYLSSRRLYRNAAASCLEKAQRLLLASNKNSPESLSDQAGSFAAAANALQLVTASDNPRGGVTAETGGQYILCDYRELPSVHKRKRTQGELPLLTDAVEHKARVVVTLHQIQQWSAVTHAYVALAQRAVYASNERHSGVLPPPLSEINELIPKLLQHDMYETAVELSAGYNLTLVPIFDKLAAVCISAQLHRHRESGLGDQPLAKRVAAAASIDQSLNVMHDSQEWKLLYRLLMQYDYRPNNQHGPTPGFELHAAVLDRVLQQDPKLGFPVTLLHTFRSCALRSLGPASGEKDCHPEGLSAGVHVDFFERTGLVGMCMLSTLLGLAVKHHTPSLLHEAAILVQDGLRAHRHAQRKHRAQPDLAFPMAEVWFPFDKLDRLVILLKFHGIETETAVEPSTGQDICPRATLTQDIENINAELAQSALHTFHAAT